MLSLIKTGFEKDVTFVEILEDGWDWPVGQAKSLESFINLKTNQRVSYWVLSDETPVGVVSFSEHKDYGKTQIGYFIHPNYRKQGILEEIINPVIVLFNDFNVELIASVDINNERSIKALRRITSIEPICQFEFSKNRYALLFVLTADAKQANNEHEGILNVLKNDKDFLESLKR